jgi:hypothetical protein
MASVTTLLCQEKRGVEKMVAAKTQCGIPILMQYMCFSSLIPFWLSRFFSEGFCVFLFRFFLDFFLFVSDKGVNVKLSTMPNQNMTRS